MMYTNKQNSKVQAFILAMLIGLLLGVSIIFLSILAALTYGYWQDTEINIPGLLSAGFTIENGLPALYFKPNFYGLFAVIVLFAVVYAAHSSLRGRQH